jgi:hypothetical protein
MALHLANRLSSHSVPALVSGLAATLLFVVPPVVSGRLAVGKAYLLAAAILTLAVVNGAPYTVLVTVATLPLIRTGSAGDASPEAVAVAPTGGAGTTTGEVAIRHVVVGIGYGLASACVGSVLVGAWLAGLPLPSSVGVPTGALVGGLLIGGAFVGLQLWRYRALGARLDWRTAATTAGLGGLLVLSPAVTYWRFGGL